MKFKYLILLFSTLLISCSQPDVPQNNDNSNDIVDTDGDGIPNDFDDCPNTAEGELVFNNGCSPNQLDEDGDGVTDLLDLCPDTINGDMVDLSGCGECQQDSDDDGVVNCSDLCTETLEGSPVTSYGCLDTDGDGYADMHELCPLDPDKRQPGDCGCGMPESDDCGGMIAFIDGVASVTRFLDFEEKHEYWIILDEAQDLKYEFQSDHPGTLYARFEVRTGCQNELWTGIFGYNQETEEEFVIEGIRYLEEGIYCISIDRPDPDMDHILVGYYTIKFSEID